MVGLRTSATSGADYRESEIIDNRNDKKQIIFLRHSITYMNEYLGRTLRFGAPGFTDVFDNQVRDEKFLDTPLSEWGIRLVKKELAWRRPAFVENLDLIVTSPLRRALQTLDLGLMQPHFANNDDEKSNNPPLPTIIAQPDASERLYLISDVGRSVATLETEYPNVDFDLCRQRISTPKKENNDVHAWWWTQEKSALDHYVEWRPSGQGQSYACKGEPQKDFDARMMRLYQWLEQRPEQCILVVCHHGVVEHMLDMDFDNCQWKQVPFAQLAEQMMKMNQEGVDNHANHY